MPVRKRVGAAPASLTNRLLAVLTDEMATLEGEAAAGTAGPASGKARLDALGQMTRTLEKLIELKRLEAGGAGDGADAPRLRREMMRRLRALEARRNLAARAVGAAAGGASAPGGPGEP